MPNENDPPQQSGDPSAPNNAPLSQPPGATSLTLDLEEGVEKPSSADVQVPPQAASFYPQTEPWDPVRSTDSARKAIGFVLLGLLFAIVLLAFWMLFVINRHALDVGTTVIDAIRAKGGDPTKLAPILQITVDESKANSDRLTALLNIVFGPVVTLLGSVTGFYFGTQSARTAAADAASPK